MARPALSADEVDATRERLAAAALSLYREQGLDALSFRTLAEALGISHTQPYRYFESKDALLAQMRVQAMQGFETFIRRREPADAPVLARVRAVFAAYLAYVQTQAADYRLIFATEQPPPDRYPALLAARRRLFEHAVALVQDAIDAGLIRGEARTRTHLIWASLHGLLSLHAAKQLVHGATLEQLAEPLLALLFSDAPSRLAAAI
jgi:AcrR family transcriptional regulator